MTGSEESIPLDQLLQHSAWLQALARRLVSDDARAEDLVQETYLAAAQRPPRRAPRAWLRAVAGNLARRLYRDDIRRRRREEVAARPEAVHATAEELVERVEVQRRIVDAVLGLEEPQRSAILLRFYEGLSAAEIARRQGAPVTTVRSRLQSAMETLRGRLDRLHAGDRRAWLAILAPLAAASAPLSAEAASAAGASPAGAASSGASSIFWASGGLKAACAVGIAGVALVAAAIGWGRLFVAPPEQTDPEKIAEGAPSDPIPGFTYLRKNPEGYGEYRHEPTGILFVHLPGGRFRMGSPETEAGSKAEERPRHEVDLSPFFIAKYEVSQAEWDRAMGTRPSKEKGDSLPVTMVSWTDCQEFCRRTGLSLPTEAQWEYACRAGTETAFSVGEDLPEGKANFLGPATLPVASGEPNGFGLHHMHGNVSELCEDEYEEGFYRQTEALAQDPRCGLPYDQRPLQSYFRLRTPRRVIRGGHVSASPGSGSAALEAKSYCRSASRAFRSPSWGEAALGLRPVRSIGASGARSIDSLAQAIERGARWSDVREDIAGWVHEKRNGVAPLIRSFIERGDATNLELESALDSLRRIDPLAACEVAARFLDNENAGVRAQAALALLGAPVEAGSREEAFRALEEVFRRPRDLDLSEYAVAEAVDQLLVQGSIEARKTVTALLASDDFGTSLKWVRPRIVRSLALAGIPDGLRYYLRVLEIRGNRLGRARFAEDVSVANAFAGEIVERYAPLDPEIAAIRGSTDFKSEDRVAALGKWLRRQIENLK
ncbi:MAG: sigma-70 family RNA polymerase sigma factor [Planctomycetes bacterium]|nr:sigma-70 family RNA polymerase sigma factor [Planctomycetota bacterium]